MDLVRHRVRREAPRDARIGRAVQEAIVETDLLLELARFVERIAAIARTGLAFKPDGYDSERYEELLKEAARVHAALAQTDVAAAEAMRRKWRESVISGFDGYVTTAVGVGAMVFN